MLVSHEYHGEINFKLEDSTLEQMNRVKYLGVTENHQMTLRVMRLKQTDIGIHCSE